ncbi:hypothetical protein CHARACLAT_025353 [Characodon lateralis]|uniref:Uncharacterized protein n=1 Tax=Characodon lateralis TaxID=208331 RepID=A0ABU7E4S6_9TELE|nr:hypothetical protein [Characodon lateralis]
MGAIHICLILLLLASSPVCAQWWRFIWPDPKTTTVPPTLTSPTVTSQEPSTTQGIPSKSGLGKEDKVTAIDVEGTQIGWSMLSSTPHKSEKLVSQRTVNTFTLSPGRNSGESTKGRSTNKPLKQWKNEKSSGSHLDLMDLIGIPLPPSVSFSPGFEGFPAYSFGSEANVGRLTRTFVPEPFYRDFSIIVTVLI